MRKKSIKNTDNVPTVDQILLMNEDKAKKIITGLREKYSIKTLCTYWGVSTGYVYNNFIYKYNIETKPLIRKNNLKNGDNKLKDNKITENTSIENKDITENKNNESNINDSNVVVYVPEKSTHLIDFEGIRFSFNGTCNGQALESKLKKFANMVESDSNYRIKFMLEEIQ